jgi:hypothetical protein
MKVRDLYFLHQVSALSTIPAPTKHREKFWSLLGLMGALNPHFFMYREGHDPEFFVSIQEIVGLIGTNIVC